MVVVVNSAIRMPSCMPFYGQDYLKALCLCKWLWHWRWGLSTCNKLGNSVRYRSCYGKVTSLMIWLLLRIFCQQEMCCLDGTPWGKCCSHHKVMCGVNFPVYGPAGRLVYGTWCCLCLLVRPVSGVQAGYLASNLWPDDLDMQPICDDVRLCT